MKSLFCIIILVTCHVLSAQKGFYAGLSVGGIKDRQHNYSSNPDVKQGSFLWTGVNGHLTYITEKNSGIEFSLGVRTFGRSFTIVSSLGTNSRASSGYKIGIIKLSTFHSFNVWKDKIFLTPQVGISYASISGDRGGEMKGSSWTNTDSLSYWSNTNYKNLNFFLLNSGMSVDYKYESKFIISVYYNYNSGLNSVYKMDIQYQTLKSGTKYGSLQYDGTYHELGIKVLYRITN